jgi:hypothetical protein
MTCKTCVAFNCESCPHNEQRIADRLRDVLRDIPDKKDNEAEKHAFKLIDSGRTVAPR